jgi:polyhydroxyalkanoate synthesis regulator phasin
VRSGASAAARGRMAARGSERIVDAIEELILELPARVRGSRTKLSEQALGAVRALVDDLNLASREDLDELELRVAQIEHRLRLLEQERDAPLA